MFHGALRGRVSIVFVREAQDCGIPVLSACLDTMHDQNKGDGN